MKNSTELSNDELQEGVSPSLATKVLKLVDTQLKILNVLQKYLLNLMKQI
jgi:hypothetical protein